MGFICLYKNWDGYLQVMVVNAQNDNTWTRFGGQFLPKHLQYKVVFSPR